MCSQGIARISRHVRSLKKYYLSYFQGTHCTGKTGEMVKTNPCQGKHREFVHFAKTQGIWFAQVINSLILKVKDISEFAAKISKKILTIDKSVKSVLCM